MQTVHFRKNAGYNEKQVLLDHRVFFSSLNRILGLKKARTNILNSARSSIARLIFLTNINFPNYHSFNDATEAYDDFIQKIMVPINKVVPIKERRIKHNSQEWFNGEIFEAIKNHDKLLKKFKRSRLHIDKELYNAAQYKVH